MLIIMVSCRRIFFSFLNYVPCGGISVFGSRESVQVYCKGLLAAGQDNTDSLGENITSI